jgi:hypothetical protein
VIITTSNSNQPPQVESNNFDYVRAFANTQSSNPIIVAELIQAYILIAQNQNITPIVFINNLQNQNLSNQELIFLAASLNSVRPRNALIGIAGQQNTPVFVLREISA